LISPAGVGAGSVTAPNNNQAKTTTSLISFIGLVDFNVVEIFPGFEDHPEVANRLQCSMCKDFQNNGGWILRASANKHLESSAHRARLANLREEAQTQPAAADETVYDHAEMDFIFDVEPPEPLLRRRWQSYRTFCR